MGPRGQLALATRLLDPPEKQEESQMDKVITLLEAISESQVRTEHRLLRLESALAAKVGISVRQ